MAHADITWADGCGVTTWDCSCGEDDQVLDETFWEAECLECSRCGALFDLELDGGTEEGFIKTPRHDPQAKS